jgi:glycosyltransferase involved in cell wall biosynthesis
MPKKSKYPLVSVCIPTYNGETFINEAMESAIAQTYPNLEIVISDDASQDATLKIIEDFKKKTCIPIYIHHHKPTGIGANWNNCIRKAQGDYIKFLFQDDILLPSCIEEMLQVLENDNSINLVVSKRDILVEESFKSEKTRSWIQNYGDLQKSLNLEFKNGVSIITREVFKLDTFFQEPLNKMGEPTVIFFKKNIVNNIGFYNEDLAQILDFEFTNRILLKYNVAILDKKLVKFRLHKDQATNSNFESVNLDFDIYNDIIYNDYFWYLNRKVQWQLLKNRNILVKLFFRLKHNFLRLIKSNENIKN